MSFVPFSSLFSSPHIYVIPTFQRPYAWEEPQWDDLIHDIQSAAAHPDPYRYFAPIHVVEINNPSEYLWSNYTDCSCHDIASLSASNFRDIRKNALTVFLVVDGQQRLITFYSLLYIYGAMTLGFIDIPSLSGGILKIPRVILNPLSDHDFFRKLLGLPSSFGGTISLRSKAQERLERMFNKISGIFNNDERDFFTSRNCEILHVSLRPGAKLQPFMSLNDRGKDLTNLEKSKSLLMEIDDKYPPISGSSSHVINNAFGKLYQSLERVNAYIGDEEFLRQVSMVVWEGATHRIHGLGPNLIYKNYFKEAKPLLTGSFLTSDVIPAIETIATEHNNLDAKLSDAKSGIKLGVASFTNSLTLGFSPRDAIEDYYAVLISLGLQTKEIGFLFSVHDKLKLPLHQPLGNFSISNASIKTQLTSILAAICRDSDISPEENIVQEVNQDIASIPNTDDRRYTALQIAEALRLLVGTSKPGGFSGTWDRTFRSLITPSSQDIVNNWLTYILGFGSRDAFIYRVATGKDAYNANRWVPYLLKEYEIFVGGGSAHRSDFQIEHFFASSLDFSTILTCYGFISLPDFRSTFVDQIGNKLVLDTSLNEALGNLPPIDKVVYYGSHTYGHVNAMAANPSHSALEIASKLSGISKLSNLRFYVQLRSLKLAAFAARRF